MKISEIEKRINASYNTIKKFVESNQEYYFKKNNVIHVTSKGIEELEQKYGVKSELLTDEHIDFYKNQIMFLRQQLEDVSKYNEMFLKQIEVKDFQTKEYSEKVEELERIINEKEIEKLELKHELELEKNKSLWKKIFNKN